MKNKKRIQKDTIVPGQGSSMSTVWISCVGRQPSSQPIYPHQYRLAGNYKQCLLRLCSNGHMFQFQESVHLRKILSKVADESMATCRVGHLFYDIFWPEYFGPLLQIRDSHCPWKLYKRKSIEEWHSSPMLIRFYPVALRILITCREFR